MGSLRQPLAVAIATTAFFIISAPSPASAASPALRRPSAGLPALARLPGVRGVQRAPRESRSISNHLVAKGGGGRRSRALIRRAQEDEEIRRRNLSNMIPGIIGMVGGIVTLLDEFYVATTACAPTFLTPQVERWGAVVVLSTFFCTSLSFFITGGFLTDFIEDTQYMPRNERTQESKAALFLRLSEWLAILAMTYSAGVATVQISRYGPRLDINEVSDKVCIERMRDEAFLKRFPEWLGDEWQQISDR